MIILALFISSCSTSICSTPYISVGGDCCLDLNGDGNCENEKESINYENTSSKKIKPNSEMVGDIVFTGANSLYNFTEDDTFSNWPNYYLGNENGKISFSIYGGYHDGITKKFNNDILPILLENYSDKVRFEFKLLPKDFILIDRLAEEAVYCAGEQGFFWEYHNKLFSEKTLTKSDFNIFAFEMGLDVIAFEDCMASSKYKPLLEAYVENFDKDHVGIIPTFWINEEKRVSGFRSLNYFEEILDEYLKYSKEYEIKKKIIVSSQGDSYIIFPSIAVKDITLKNSYYSNKIDFIESKIYFSADDIDHKDSIFSKDEAILNIDFKMKDSNHFGDYSIQLTSLRTVGEMYHNHYGGVATDLLFFGESGRGTNLLPKTNTHVYVWGKGKLFKNNNLIYDDLFVDFYVVDGVREEGKITNSQEDDIEAYAFIQRSSGEDIEDFEGGKLYLFWEDSINFKSV
jgi:hypothetical protein